jgi:hypothetical protein
MQAAGAAQPGVAKAPSCGPCLVCQTVAGIGVPLSSNMWLLVRKLSGKGPGWVGWLHKDQIRGGCDDQWAFEAKAGTAMETREKGVPAFSRWSRVLVETA